MGGDLWNKSQEFLSKEIQREQLEPGDHIYTLRPGNSRAHHGIYVEDEKVIHFTPKAAGQEEYYGGSSPLSSPSDNPCPTCSGQAHPSPPQLAGVLCTCVDHFLNGGRLYRFEYGVDPDVFLAKPRGLTCTLTCTDLPHVVTHRASFLLQKGRFRVRGRGHGCKNNSEDFAVYCKTGLLRIRVRRTLSALTCAVFLPLLLLYALTPAGDLITAWGAALGLVVIYSTCRLASDIGARPDVRKVAVEELGKVKLEGLDWQSALKGWIFLVLGIWLYLILRVPECCMLFCWAVLERNFNFRKVLFNKISVDELKRGDHIYSPRGYLYTHHGIYTGDGMVIHIDRGPGTILFSADPSRSSEGRVVSISIEDFRSGGELYRYEYGVKPGFFIAKTRGDGCTLASSNPPADVLRNATFLMQHCTINRNNQDDLGRKGAEESESESMKMSRLKSKKTGFGAYHLFRNNCEDFAIYCKTGYLVREFIPAARSGQVACILAAFNFVASFQLPCMTGSATLCRAAAGYCIYSICRVMADTKCRWDACRVPVEKLADGFDKLGGVNSKQFLILLSKAFLVLIIVLWSLSCPVLRLLGKGSALGCDLNIHHLQTYGLLSQIFV